MIHSSINFWCQISTRTWKFLDFCYIVCCKWVTITDWHNVIQGLEDIHKFFHHILRWIQSFKLVNLFEKRSTFLQTCFQDTQLFKNFLGLTILHFVGKRSPNHHSKCSLDQSANEVCWWQIFYYSGIVVEIIRFDGEVYYIVVVFCLFPAGFCLKTIPKETVQRIYGSLYPFFPQVNIFHFATWY